MTRFYSGIAGARGHNPRGIVIHNDAGSQGATAHFYRNWLPTHEAELGFAHYYVGSDGIHQAENEANKAWHTANQTGNAEYIGIEACQSMGEEGGFRDNEARSLKLAAEVLKRYGLPANHETVKLHKEFVSTSCPHRSSDLHGGSIQAVKAYYIEQIKKYMGGDVKPQPNDKSKTIEEDMQMLFYTVDTKRWYISNGTAIRYIRTVRILDTYRDKWARLNLPMDRVYQGELDKEFGKDQTKV